MNKYRFSPTFLDKFQAYINSEDYFQSEQNWNDESGYYKTLEQIQEERKQDLLDALNGVKKPATMAMAIGTALNQAVDTMVTTGILCSIEDSDGMMFQFDPELVNGLAKCVEDADCQRHLSVSFLTEYGEVLLHGYPDYIQEGVGEVVITDLKTTGRYEFGKYEGYWQRKCYPYLYSYSLLRRQGADIRFQFLVAEVKKPKDGVISGDIMHEEYGYTESDELAVRFFCETFAMWCETNRDLITSTQYCQFE